MALSKATQTVQGASASYWKIVSINIDKVKLMASINIGLFLTQTIADTGTAQPFMVRNFIIPVTKAQCAGDLTAVAYAAIKAQAVSPAEPPRDTSLVGATDVLEAGQTA